jgi:hypothetical protein
MRLLAALALLAPLGACKEAPEENFPISPGGGSGTGGQFTPDAAVTGDGGMTITGRVCLLIIDPQTLMTCAANGAGNITVTLGTSTALTADDGSFTIVRPADTTGLTWFVSGGGVQRSALAFGTLTTLPAIDANEYEIMLASINTIVGTGNGSIIMRVASGGFPVQGATVAISTAQSGIFYDGPSDVEWQTLATGPAGVAWAPSVTAGTASAVITVGATQTNVTGIQVFPDTVTFTFPVLP